MTSTSHLNFSFDTIYFTSHDHWNIWRHSSWKFLSFRRFSWAISLYVQHLCMCPSICYTCSPKTIEVTWTWFYRNVVWVDYTLPTSLVRPSVIITKTCLYNVDPLKPHFYIVKLGFTGVYIIFLISAQNIDCGYSLEPPRWGSSNEYPQSMFWAEIRKISEFLSDFFF